jgi:hypothetical protein
LCNTRSRSGARTIRIGGWTFEEWRGGGLPQTRELSPASCQVTEINGTSTQKPESFGMLAQAPQAA